MRGFTNYLFYNNTIPIVAIILALSGGSVLAANEQVREAVAETIVTSDDYLKNFDNSYLLDIDLAEFDFKIKIEEITENDDNYFITYSFDTIEIRDGMWQPVSNSDTLTVAKAALGKRDLGLYVAEELNELASSMRTYLAEAQAIETAQGRSDKKIERRYSGLIGRFLDNKDVSFDGYSPVVKETESVVKTPKPVAVKQPQSNIIINNNNLVQNDNSIAGTATSSADGVSEVDANPSGISTSQAVVASSTLVDSSTSTESVATTSEIADTAAPIITLNGSEAVIVSVGGIYTDAGATAFDIVDGDISSEIVVTNDVDTSSVGSYSVTYTVSDIAGNVSSLSRVVVVEENQTDIPILVGNTEPEPEPETEPVPEIVPVATST